jgi:hypothetical protein
LGRPWMVCGWGEDWLEKSDGNALFCWTDALMVKPFPGGGGRGKVRILCSVPVLSPF